VTIDLRHGDALELARDLEPASVHALVTSPPYWRQRTNDDSDRRQAGREDQHPDSWAGSVADVLAACWPALVPSGAMLINIASAYSGGGYGATSKIASRRKAWQGTMRDRGRRNAPFAYPERNLVLLGALLIEALQRRCPLYLRSEIVWSKPTAGEPATISDRPPRRHEFVYVLSRSPRSRLHDFPPTDVWTISPSGGRSPNPSTAAMPEELATRLVACSTVVGETVLDPFAGGATTLLAADRLSRHGVGFELQSDLVLAARQRIFNEAPLFHTELNTNGTNHDTEEVMSLDH
jgi:DNA modification methylase